SDSVSRKGRQSLPYSSQSIRARHILSARQANRESHSDAERSHRRRSEESGALHGFSRALSRSKKLQSRRRTVLARHAAEARFERSVVGTGNDAAVARELPPGGRSVR